MANQIQERTEEEKTEFKEAALFAMDCGFFEEWILYLQNCKLCPAFKRTGCKGNSNLDYNRCVGYFREGLRWQKAIDDAITRGDWDFGNK